MNQTSSSRRKPALTVLGCVLLAMLGVGYYSNYYKLIALLATAACVFLLLRKDLRPLKSVPALLLLGYVAFSGLTRFWALSGKFFLQNYSVIATSCSLFLAIMLARQFDRDFVRRIMLLIAGASAVYCVLSVEAATSGLTQSVLPVLFSGLDTISMGFEAGTRLTGVLGNANILSSVVALGVFFSVCLVCGEEKPAARCVYAGLLAVNAFVFLLLFSMGGTACFAVAILAYLAFAGKDRIPSLIRMLEGAVPTLLWVFAAFPFFNREGAAGLVPIVALAGDVVTVVLLEKFLAPKLTAALEGRGKLAPVVIGGLLVLVAVYAALGYNLTGPYTFGGGALRRAAYPEPGVHTLEIEATGDVNVTVTSQNMAQVMMHTNTVLYRGAAQDAQFTVPEDSEVCYFDFTAGDGTVLSQAGIDGSGALRLRYTLLPGFIANRLQGLWANQNAIQRVVFFRDGMKMFFQSPLVGSGVGSFETGITSVQEFYYETKYIHNHYIQVLLESGVIGFVLFAGALAGMVVLLLKKRSEEDWQFRGEYPALWAALVMILTHMAVEVSMSQISFLVLAFMTFALILRCCGPEYEHQAVSKKNRARARRWDGRRIAVHVACAALPAVFLVSLVCNMAAVAICTNPNVASISEFLGIMDTAVRLDPYEANDAKLTYVMNAYRNQVEWAMPQANEYAEQLLRQQSNSIPIALTEYYLYTGQYENAIRAAKAGAAYSASDADTWNKTVSVLRSLLIGYYSPLVTEGTEPLTGGVMEYYEMLRAHNQTSMEDIALTLDSMDFFSKMISLSRNGSDTGTTLAILNSIMFDSAAACDANADGVPDQISARSGADFTADGAAELAAGGQFDLTVRETAISDVGALVIECEDPAALTVTDLVTGYPLELDLSTPGQAVFSFAQTQEDGFRHGFRIASTSAQTLSYITCMTL